MYRKVSRNLIVSDALGGGGQVIGFWRSRAGRFVLAVGIRLFYLALYGTIGWVLSDFAGLFYAASGMFLGMILETGLRGWVRG